MDQYLTKIWDGVNTHLQKFWGKHLVKQDQVLKLKAKYAYLRDHLDKLEETVILLKNKLPKNVTSFTSNKLISLLELNSLIFLIRLFPFDL